MPTLPEPHSGGKSGAQFHSGDNLEVISRPEVNTVIVSTSEHEHALPVLQPWNKKGRPYREAYCHKP